MRSWELFVPLPTWGLNLERSMHWAVHSRRTKEYRYASKLLATQSKIPRLDRVSIYAWPQGPNMRQDVGAAFPSAKAAIDGLVDAKILPNDTTRHVVRLTMLPHKRGEHGLWLMIVDESED